MSLTGSLDPTQSIPMTTALHLPPKVSRAGWLGSSALDHCTASLLYGHRGYKDP